MTRIPNSYIEIDGFRIEGDSGLVLSYVFAVKNALAAIAEQPGKDVWVGVDGTVELEEDGFLTVASHTQSVRLTNLSRVNYQIVEDDLSRRLFADGILGQAGKKFMDAYYPADEEGDDS
ncbi:MAG: hypothetical protein LCH36_10220 [Actinobacteria bacterium]|nr:hypothetical protein [Actinomycetota bacterium]